MRKQNHHIVLVIAIALLASAGPAFGQFLVQPMRMYLAVRPGRIFKTTLDLQSLDPNEAHSIDLSVVELTQWEDGEWRILEDPNTDDFDTSTLSSCKEWIRFRPARVDLGPMEAESVEVFLRVPPGVRGFYTAGILATLRPRLATDISVILRFLVPLLTEVQGRPMRHRIEFEGIGLEFVDELYGHLSVFRRD